MCTRQEPAIIDKTRRAAPHNAPGAFISGYWQRIAEGNQGRGAHRAGKSGAGLGFVNVTHRLEETAPGRKR